MGNTFYDQLKMEKTEAQTFIDRKILEIETRLRGAKEEGKDENYIRVLENGILTPLKSMSKYNSISLENPEVYPDYERAIELTKKAFYIEVKLAQDKKQFVEDKISQLRQEIQELKRGRQA